MATLATIMSLLVAIPSCSVVLVLMRAFTLRTKQVFVISLGVAAGDFVFVVLVLSA